MASNPPGPYVCKIPTKFAASLVSNLGVSLTAWTQNATEGGTWGLTAPLGAISDITISSFSLSFSWRSLGLQDGWQWNLKSWLGWMNTLGCVWGCTAQLPPRGQDWDLWQWAGAATAEIHPPGTAAALWEAPLLLQLPTDTSVLVRPSCQVECWKWVVVTS